MKIIGVCGRKGGSGKTTTAIHLAAEIAHRGHSTALIDADPQASAKHWSKPGHLPMAVESWLLDDGAGAWSRRVYALPVQFVIIDTAPHLDTGMAATLALSDLAILPCGPSILDLHALRHTLTIVARARSTRKDGGPLISILPTRVDTRTASGRQLPSVLAREKEDVAPSLHLRMALTDAANTGDWVGNFAPDSPAHAEVKLLTDHILKRLGEKSEGKAK